MKEFWKRRDPILRMEQYMKETGWMTEARWLSCTPMCSALLTRSGPSRRQRRCLSGRSGGDVYCDNSVEIPVKYGEVRVKQANQQRKLSESSAPGHYK